MRICIAGNWKMYKTPVEAAETLTDLADRLTSCSCSGRDILVFAPYTSLEAVSRGMLSISGGMAGAQNVYPAEEGAFTGEISPCMIRACGASWVLTGHSERRHILGESDEFVGEKTAFALTHGLNVILCIGEKLEERESGGLEEVLERQLRTGLAGTPVESADLAERLMIAYEPVWAIGTGRTAGEADIVDAHGLTRSILEKILGPVSCRIRLLYGGSVKPENAGTILKLDNVNGVLVGGASLQAESFSRIIMA